MKKIISVLIAILTLTSLFTAALHSFAAETSDALSIGTNGPYILSGGVNCHTFTPNKTASYEFFSSSDANCDLYIAIAEGETYLNGSSRGRINNDFSISSTLTKDTEYLIFIGEENGLEGSYELTVRESTVRSISVTREPFGYDASDIDEYGTFIGSFEGLSVLISFTEEADKEPISYVFDKSGSGYIGDNELYVEGFGMTDDNGNAVIMFRITFMGASFGYLTDSDCKYVGLEIVSPPAKLTYDRYEDASVFDFYSPFFGEYLLFYYYEVDLSGLVIDITFPDLSVTRYSYDDDADVLEEMGLEAIFGGLLSEPAEPGRGEVILMCENVFASFDVTVTDPGFADASITRAPDESVSVKNGAGFFDESGSFFYYTDSTDGLAFELTYENGSKALFDSRIDPSFLSDITLMDDQLNSPWEPGEHNVAAFYKGYYLGTYIFTVLEKEIEKVSVGEKAAVAKWYPEDEDITVFDESGLSARIDYSDGTYENVSLSDVEFALGSGRYLSFDVRSSNDGNDLLYGFVRSSFADPDIPDPIAIYEKFEKILIGVTSFEVTSEPRSLSCVRDVGYDFGLSDFTGFSLKATFSDGSEKTYVCNERKLPESICLGDESVKYALTFSESSLEFVFRGKSSYAAVTEVKTVADYITERITESCEVTVTDEVSLPVYAFTAKHDSALKATLKSDDIKSLLCLSVFGEDGYSDIERSAYYFDGTNEDGSVSCIFEIKKGSICYFVPTDQNFIGNPCVLTLDFDITVTKWNGDIDGDGIVSSKDLLSMKKYLTDTYSDEQIAKLDLDAADIDGDGIVSTKDLLKLKKILLGID